MVINTSDTIIVHPMKTCPVCFGQMRRLTEHGLTSLKNSQKKKFCTNNCRYKFVKSLTAMKTFDKMVTDLMSGRLQFGVNNKKVKSKSKVKVKHKPLIKLKSKKFKEPKPEPEPTIIHETYKIKSGKFYLKHNEYSTKRDYAAFRIIFRQLESSLVNEIKYKTIKYKTIKGELAQMKKIKPMIGDTFYQDEIDNMIINHPYYSNNRISNDQIATTLININDW